MRRLIAAGLLSSFVATAPSGASIKTEEFLHILAVRRDSIAALESGKRGARSAAARAEQALALNNIARVAISGVDTLTIADLATVLTPQNIAGDNAADMQVDRGGVNGPSQSFHALKAGTALTFEIEVRGHESALALLSSRHAGLVLKMQDISSGKECRDRLVRGVAFCRLFPAHRTRIQLTIGNPTENRAVVSLITN